MLTSHWGLPLSIILQSGGTLIQLQYHLFIANQSIQDINILINRLAQFLDEMDILINTEELLEFAGNFITSFSNESPVMPGSKKEGSVISMLDGLVKHLGSMTGMPLTVHVPVPRSLKDCAIRKAYCWKPYITSIRRIKLNYETIISIWNNSLAQLVWR